MSIRDRKDGDAIRGGRESLSGDDGDGDDVVVDSAAAAAAAVSSGDGTDAERA